MPWPVLRTSVPGEAVSGLEGDGPDPVLADLLGHLGGNPHVGAVDGDGELELGVDLGQVSRRELHIHDRAGDADDAAVRRAVSPPAGGTL